MSVRQINGRWRMDTWVRYPDGTSERIRKWIQVNTRTQAREFEQQVISAALRGEYGKPKKAEAPTVADFEATFLRFVKGHRKASTLKSYRDALRKHIVPALGRTRLDAVGHAQVERLKDALADLELSKKTVNNVVGVLSAMLELAKKQRHIQDKPPIDWYAVRRIEEPALTESEYDRLEGAADPEWRTMMRTAVLSGLRLGELCQLRWSHVDLEAGWFYVREAVYRGKVDSPKHGKERDVPIAAELVPMLKALRRPGVELVFSTTRGQRYQPYNAPTEGMRRASRKAALGRDCGWHLLRHTWATWLARKGVKAKDLMTLGGWGSLSQVERYVNLSSADLQGAIALLSPQARFGQEESQK